MTTKQIVKQALAYCDLSNAELARRLDWSPQLLSKRLSTGKLSPEEWRRSIYFSYEEVLIKEAKGIIYGYLPEIDGIIYED